MRRLSRQRDPAAAARLLNLAAAHMSAGRLAEAAAAYANAERAQPADFRAPMSLATIALRLGDPAQALAPLRRAARLAPQVFDAQHNLGAVAQALALWEEAAAAYERALALRPEALETRRNLAIVLAILGRTEAALDQHRALARHPQTRLWALTRIALLRPEAASEADVGEMRRAAADGAVDLDTRAGLWFALGEALERTGDGEAAFAAFAEGNRLKRESFLADPRTSPPRLLEAHRLAAKRVVETFTTGFLATRAGLGLSTEAPIFIVGMPRSGSTLIEQILASHPQVASLGETAALPRLLERGELMAAAPDKAAVRDIGRRYLDDARARGWRGASRFVDKTLENYLHVGAIAAMFPRAVILHAARDALDTCVSCFRQLFASGAETLYDLGEIGAEYVTYREVMEHWRRVLPGRVIDVDHEQLVEGPEAQIRWLVTEACGLAWNDACLAFHETPGAVRTASSAQVRQPIFRTSLGRWRRYAAHLGPLIVALGEYGPGV